VFPASFIKRFGQRAAVLVLLCICGISNADTVKPALIEVSADSNGNVNVELRANLERILTGINTGKAEPSDTYDTLRVLTGEQLKAKLGAMEAQVLQAIWLHADTGPVALQLEDASIPEPGYLQSPRISELRFIGQLESDTTALQVYYPARFGESTVRLGQVGADSGNVEWSPWQWSRNDEPTTAFSLAVTANKPPFMDVLKEYVRIGFTHVIPLGIDHILFILALLLLSNRFKPLFWQVAMFTLAHSLTLGLAMAGYISIPARIVEPLIAASIAWVALENIVYPGLSRFRLLVVCLFGLLHGLGFASVLTEIKKDTDTFLTAILGFNIGVELAQIALIAAGFVLIILPFGNRSWYRNFVVIPCSLTIAAIGLLWLYNRLAFT